MIQGSLLLAPFVAYVAVRSLTGDRQWRLIAEAGLIGYVVVCLVALIVRAGP